MQYVEREKSISRNQDLTKDIPCGCFFVKYVCCVGFEPPRQGGSVQGLGDWKAPVCQRQKSAANEAKRNKSISRNQLNKKYTHVVYFLFNLLWIVGLCHTTQLFGSKFVCENKHRAPQNLKNFVGDTSEVQATTNLKNCKILTLLDSL